MGTEALNDATMDAYEILENTIKKNIVRYTPQFFKKQPSVHSDARGEDLPESVDLVLRQDEGDEKDEEDPEINRNFSKRVSKVENKPLHFGPYDTYRPFYRS